MPRQDPLPTKRAKRVRQFQRVVKLLGLLSLIVAGTAVVLVAGGGKGVHIQIMIAAALAIGLTVFLGTALGVMFLSSPSWHEEPPARTRKEIESE